jgi:hypothetical protein
MQRDLEKHPIKKFEESIFYETFIFLCRGIVTRDRIKVVTEHDKKRDTTNYSAGEFYQRVKYLWEDGYDLAYFRYCGATRNFTFKMVDIWNIDLFKFEVTLPYKEN